MKSKLNPISIGSFVIGGIILLVIGLISFQSINIFNQPLQFVSYFDESVQGLDVGSSVKLRGVNVGRVVAIKVQYDEASRQSEIAVICELNKSSICNRLGKAIKITNASVLNNLVDSGLRAKIDLAGITGIQFVQLDFLNPEKHKAEYPKTNSPLPVIPTVDSGMSKLTDNLVKIADSAQKIDFEGISNDLKRVLESTNDKLEGVDLKKMVSQITSAASSIQRLAAFLDQNPSSLIFGRKSKTQTGR